MLARDEDILKAAEEWRKSGRGVALATVVEHANAHDSVAAISGGGADQARCGVLGRVRQQLAHRMEHGDNGVQR